MTIGLGIMTSDALVLAADSQMTAGGWKYTHGKVYFKTRVLDDGTRLSVVMTGAGEGPFLTGLWEDISQQISVSDGLESFAVEVEAVFEHYYEKHVIPFLSLNMQEPPSLEVAIAASAGGRYKFWSTHLNAMITASSWAAVGSGAQIAGAELTYTLDPYLHIGAADGIVLAIYTISQVKKSDVNCGSDTDLVCLLGDRVVPFDRGWTRAIESLCDNWRKFAPVFMWSAFGATDVAAEAEVSNFRKHFGELKAKIDEHIGPSR